METRFIVVLLAVATVTSDGLAQTGLAPGVPSALWAPVQPIASTDPDTLGEVRSGPFLPEQQHRSRRTSTTVAAAVLSSIGSFGGFYAGAMIGYSTGKYDENIEGLLIGGAMGSALGATAGSAAFTGRFGRSFLGSIGGGLVGLLIGYGVSGATNNDWFTWGAYSITHGTITALVASR